MSRFVTQDRIKVTVSSMPGSWATIAGQEAERENVKLRPGAGEPKQVVHTQLEYGDVTVTRLFDADTDAALLAKLNKGNAFAGTTITEQYLDADGNAIPGSQSIHTGCAVLSFSGPEGDANSSDMGYLTVTFSRAGAE
jgi:hypothetical protein